MNNSKRKSFQTIETFEKEYGVHFTVKHNGKMTGFASLSTSPLENTFCVNRAKCNGSICSHCYSMTMQKCYSALSNALVNNFRVLTSRIIPVEKMPILNYLMFRFESFGDVANEIQIINYFNICKKNPRVQFTIWTKNLSIFTRLFKHGFKGIKYKKPKNLIIIASSPFINKKLNIEKWPFVDKVFTVYDKEYATNNGIKINCGSNSCAACCACYNRLNKTKEINELLK